MKKVTVEVPDFSHLNLYTEEIDLPQIKPKSLNNKNEFFNEIPKNMEPEIH